MTNALIGEIVVHRSSGGPVKVVQRTEISTFDRIRLTERSTKDLSEVENESGLGCLSSVGEGKWNIQ